MDVLTSIDPTSSQPSSSDPFHPSFFELAAQSQLQELIKPAVRYVLAVLAQRNPRYLLQIVNRFDEVYALLMAGIELHYLRIWGSSFAENFYGLRRRRRPGLSSSRSAGGATSSSVAKSERLGKREIRLSLLFLVGLPYVGAKLEDLWERNGGGLSSSADIFGEERIASTPTWSQFNETEAQEPLLQRIKNLTMETFKTTFPYAKTLYQLWLLTYNVRYLYDQTPYWRPWLSLMRVDIRRVGPNDGPRRSLLPKKLPSLVRQPGKFFTKVIGLVPGILFEGLKYGLPASIFFFKFLEWWYGADNPRRRRSGGGQGANGNGGGASSGSNGEDGSVTALDPPAPLLPDFNKGLLSNNNTATIPNTIELGLPTYKLPHIFALSGEILDQLQQSIDSQHHAADVAPKLIQNDKNGQSRRLIHNSCPLCGVMPINNPAILPSGYVFCYTCAFNYVDRNRKCPITNINIPEGKDALRKVLG
ncbi:related to Peroxisome assembly protein 12 [Melanopsichium pennsylvanicum]|uniref:Peroxisome assembly protein 12 n=2 Tax=Melanopsichium pennsylvanicum TaxID=63383 RepID=A0AAJ4XFN3_9BASI|nr:related to Peroxisome assembly protein 12 [Melanopsichium pennsylvanicum 4]SNX81609.1 related to Peroxisome assembly protein 12 [Melanopsichium pennsylvanicum]